MLKYDFILRCYFKMMYWHFSADMKVANVCVCVGVGWKIKIREGGKKKSGEGRKGRWRVAANVRERLGDCPRLSLSLM